MGASSFYETTLPYEGLEEPSVYAQQAEAAAALAAAAATQATQAAASLPRLRTGSGAPSNSLGNDGDLYYDPATFLIYGPKVGGVWPSGVSLKGADGMDGTGTGDMLKADNLAGLTNVVTARTNLGLGSAATQNTSVFLQAANNLSDLVNAATARTNLGLGGAAVLNVGTTSGTVAAGNDSRITGAAQKSNNLSDLANVATARTNLGLGSAATQASTAFLQAANDLSDLGNVATARTNLGLGTAATKATGTSGNTVPLLDGANTWSKPQKTAPVALTSGVAVDASTYASWTASVGASFTVAAPTGGITDQLYFLKVTYSGAFSLSFNSIFKGVSGITPTAANGAIDYFWFHFDGTNYNLLGYRLNAGAS